MSNLEPIEESDLSLKEKFVGGGRDEAQKMEDLPVEEKKIEMPGASEAALKTEKPLDNRIEISERKEGVLEKEETYARILRKAPPTQAEPIHDEISADAKNASFEREAERKIEHLVKIAEVKGIPHAVKVARHLEDNYVLDEFHDRLLSEELHDALVRKGMIKEI